MPTGKGSRPGPVIGSDGFADSALHRPRAPWGVTPVSAPLPDEDDVAAFLVQCQKRVAGGPAAPGARSMPHPLAFLLDRNGHLLTSNAPPGERPRVCVLVNRFSGATGRAFLLADADLHAAALRAERTALANGTLQGLEIGGVAVDSASAHHWLAQGWIKAQRVVGAAATFGAPPTLA